VALTAALLFALYPRHHQVVMWFGAVSIGLAAALGLATAVLFLRAWRHHDARAGWAAAATYMAALLAHESAVVLPLLLVALALYDRVADARPPAVGVLAAGAAMPRLSGTPRAASGAALGACAGIGLGARLRPVPFWLWALPLASAAHLALLAWAYRVRAATYPDSGYRFVGLGGDLAAAPLRYAAQLVVPPPWTESLAVGGGGLALGGLALVGAAWWAWRRGWGWRGRRSPARRSCCSASTASPTATTTCRPSAWHWGWPRRWHASAGGRCWWWRRTR
jgi:hypothetical protein